MKPHIKTKYKDLKGYDLLHAGTLALATVSGNGIRIDKQAAKREKQSIEDEIETLTKKISKSPEVKLWKENYGENFNINSNEQIGTLLFETLKEKPLEVTNSGKNKVDENTLKEFADKYPFINDFIKIKKLKKAKSTYIENFISEVSDDGFMHPDFDVNSTLTYRSSSYNPNFQNIPIRNKILGPKIRQMIIPRKDHLLIEADYSGIEVCGSACYHKDPQMIKYIIDPTTDMHSDCAKDLFILGPHDWNKAIRQVAKNKFVFAQFYGSHFVECAKGLWKDIDKEQLKTNAGVPLYKHLITQGIRNYKEYEKHVERVCTDFWENRFAVYNQWKKDWYQSYLERGYFNTLTGFTCRGFMRRNAVLNYPIQGSSFHCLLWDVIHINEELALNGMDTRVVGQIHDSIILDTHPDEYNRAIWMLQRIATEEIRKVWDWIIVPLKMEIEVSPINESWNKKKEVVPHKCHTCGARHMYANRRQGEDFIDYVCPICEDTEEVYAER